MFNLETDQQALKKGQTVNADNIRTCAFALDGTRKERRSRQVRARGKWREAGRKDARCRRKAGREGEGGVMDVACGARAEPAQGHQCE
eukprot:1146132-Pelagomonas_calceolata.AAC.3